MTGPHRHPSSPRPVVPGREAIALLAPFDGLARERIHLPATAEDCEAAVTRLAPAGVVGFDTESRPTFRKGEESQGPHLVQFATDDEAFLFQMHEPASRRAAMALLESSELIKVGFGLSSDRRFLRARFGVSLAGIVDLNDVFRAAGHRGTLGVRAAVAITMNRRFLKSKKQTTSDWSAKRLNAGQILYAANDAYAALAVLRALDPPAGSLPVDTAPGDEEDRGPGDQDFAT